MTEYNGNRRLPTFMSGYVGYQIEQIRDYGLMTTEARDYALTNINRALKLYSRGYLTVNETMDIIAHPFRGYKEEEEK